MVMNKTMSQNRRAYHNAYYAKNKDVYNLGRRFKTALANGFDLEEEDIEAALYVLQLLSEPVREPLPYEPTTQDEMEVYDLLASPDFLSHVEEDYEENVIMRDESLFDLLEETARAAHELELQTQRRIAALPNFPRS